MDNKHSARILYDEEVLFLASPLSRQHEEELKIRLAYSTDLRKAYVYNRILVSGIPIYDICREMNLFCSIQEIRFQSRFDMLIFVCLQQLSLDGVPQTRRKYLIGKWFLYEIGKMVRRQKRRERENRGQAERISRVQTAQYIGKCLGCGGGVVQKYGLFAKAVDESARKAPTLIRMILQDEVRISHENMLRLSGLNKEIISLIQLGVIKNSQDHITYSDLFVKSGMQKAVQPSRPRNLQTQNRRKENTVDVSQPLIRQMPKYDPDAAISSLVLTIPSWSTNIQRAMERTDFSKISESAREGLLDKAEELKKIIESLEYKTKESGKWKIF